MKLGRSMAFVAAGLGLAIAGLAPSPLAAAPDDSSAKVDAIIQRSKTTHATYALYNWLRVTEPGQPAQEGWSAEFNAGTSHRVETAGLRLIADCEARTGTLFKVATGEITEGPEIAKTACGVDTNAAFLSKEWLGVVQTRFGPADRIRVVDRDLVREYDVTADGVLVGGTLYQNTPDRPLVLQTVRLDVLPTLPDPNMFDKASLQRSVVPEAYKTAPKAGG